MDFYMINDKDIVASANRNDFTMFLWGYLNGRFETHITCKVQKMGADHFFLISDKGGEYNVSRFFAVLETQPFPLPNDVKTGLEIKDVLEIVTGVRPETTRTGDDAIKQAAITLRNHCESMGVSCKYCPFEVKDVAYGESCCKLHRTNPSNWEIERECEA